MSMDLHLQSGTGSKTGGYQSKKGDEKREREIVVAAMIARNDRNLCVFRPDGVFGNHRTCSSAGRASALQAGVAGSIPATSTILPSDLKALVKFLSTQSPSFGSNLHELCTNAVIAVRLCTLEPPSERQRPPALFRWLDA